MRRSLLLAALAILPLVAVHAADQRDLHAPTQAEMASEARVALVIGNGAYSVGPLKNPSNDAKLIAARLRELGFQVTLVTDANRDRMRTAIIDFGRSLGKGGVGMFYYAGHGVQSAGRNYLVPVDATLTDEAYIKVQAVDMEEVTAEMEAAHNRLNIVVLDACRNNPFSAAKRSGNRGLAMLAGPTGTFIAYSASSNQVAEDGSSANSTFSSALARRMATPGASLDQVFNEVRTEVYEATGRAQVPESRSMVVGPSFYFKLQESGFAPVQALVVERPDGSVDLDKLKEQARAEQAAAAEQARVKEAARTEWVEIKGMAAKKTASTRALVEGYAKKYGAVGAASSYVGEAKTMLASWRNDTGDTGGAADTGAVAEKGKAGIEWVSIPGRSYEMSRTEVTVRQYRACVNAGSCEAPSECDWGTPNWGVSGKEDHPVNCVSWSQARTFAAWVGARLPTEVEWEYAAKGGQDYKYSGSSNVDEVAWYDKNSGGGTHPVGQKKANGYGLVDMSGNVWEWCEDASGSDRVFRSGSWDDEAWDARGGIRYSGGDPGDRGSYLGFRLSRSGS